MQDKNYECDYCGKKFVSEQRFLAHRCKTMERYEILQTSTGQTAWYLYREWMKAHRRNVKNVRSFVKSKYFNSFVRFAKHTKKVALPKPTLFIELMKEKDISPTIWTNDQVYAMYLEFLDRQCDPYKMVEITINTLFEISEAAECNVEDIFEVLTANEVIHFLRQRRLSPWFLLLSNKFMHFFSKQISSEERIIIESIVRPEYWSKKFQQHPQTVQTIKKYVKEMNL